VTAEIISIHAKIKGYPAGHHRRFFFAQHNAPPQTLRKEGARQPDAAVRLSVISIAAQVRFIAISHWHDVLCGSAQSRSGKLIIDYKVF